ncbi:vWA domain-containing protein [Candidatus Liberibacter brunswickensis]|uniref:vWA domain-containing protein n=1 Tax=Candidatus Liberibacter brunswickensis TaxID=1968796 RepID=UPI002FE414E1
MYLLSKLFLYFKKGIFSEKANFSIIFALACFSIILSTFFLIYLLDWYHKKSSMDDANNSAILAGASRMVSNLYSLGDNISNHAKRALVENTKNFIRNHIKETLLKNYALFKREEIYNIVKNSSIFISQKMSSIRSSSNLLSNNSNVQIGKNFYHLDVTTSYENNFQFIEDLLDNKNYNQKIVSFVSALLTIETGERPIFFVELVLDLSNSMNCAINSNSICKNKDDAKITALKNSVINLLDVINSSITKKEVFMGLIGYTTRVEKNIKPSFEIDEIRKYVKDMNAIETGLTDSTPAMNKAYQILTSDKKRSFLVNLFRSRTKIPSLNFQKYIVFLTDGENNNSESNTKTIKICEKARNNSIKIITVSLGTSDRSQNFLKKCVGSPEYHYDVKNISSLLQVFKDIFQTIIHRKYQVRILE